MDKHALVIFLILLFGAFFLLAQVLIVPNQTTSRREMQRLRHRMEGLAHEEPAGVSMSVLRERFRRTPSLLEQGLGWIPGMQRLARSLEHPSQSISGYAYILAAILLLPTGLVLGWLLSHSMPVSLALGGLGAAAPFLKLRSDRLKRFNRFEEQLPGALDATVRALLAGYPFAEALRQVARDMDDPIATEFRMAFEEINAGIEVRTALNNLVMRMPSVTLMAMVTTVMIQRESGGNLAESLVKISGVIRGRFSFQRRLRTLTAEGRISAWVMGLMPFVIFGGITLLQPAMIREFINNPSGQTMIAYALGFMGVGVVWLRVLLNLKV
ncbi:type II secretion system F family protein [Methyloparacoccus murrellii]